MEDLYCARLRQQMIESGQLKPAKTGVVKYDRHDHARDAENLAQYRRRLILDRILVPAAWVEVVGVDDRKIC